MFETPIEEMPPNRFIARRITDLCGNVSVHPNRVEEIMRQRNETLSGLPPVEFDSEIVRAVERALSC